MFRYLSGILFLFFFLLTSISSANAFTITVEEKADGYGGTVCTLRNAIETINTQSAFGGCPFTADAEIDTIVLLEGEYTLSIPPADQNGSSNSAGDLNVEVSMNITGQGVDMTSVSGRLFPANDTDRIFALFQNCEAGDCEDLEVTFQDFTIRDGHTQGFGGGIYHGQRSSVLYLERMRLTQNSADDAGGGIFSFGFDLVNDSTFDQNSAGLEGGGIFLNRSLMVLQNSTVNNNMAVGEDDKKTGAGGSLFGLGGGILAGGNLLAVNSTISSNQAGEAGGGIFFEGRIFDASGEEAQGPAPEFQNYLFNVTVADNMVLNSEFGFGGGIAARFQKQEEFLQDQSGVEGALILGAVAGVYNTLIARNQALDGPDCFGAYGSGGYNLIGVLTENCMAFDQMGDKTNVADPGLGSLQDNGGPTQTHGLLPGSPAIDMGNNVEGCQTFDVEALMMEQVVLVPLNEDQRHFPRPIAVLDPNNPICDIGAFEFQVFDFDVTKVDNVGGQTAVGNQFTYIITVTNSGPGVATSVLLTDPLPALVTFNSVTSDQGTCMASGNTVECDLGTLNVGQTVTVQVLVTVVADGTFTNVVTVTSEGGDTQQSITKEAQTSTQTTGGGGGGFFFFGSGCQLAAWPVTGASSLAYLGFALLGLGWWRRRSS